MSLPLSWPGAQGQRPRRALLVQLSAMGDQVQTLPAVSDILARWPELELHWVVDQRFADIARLHPGVRQVHALALKAAQQRQPGALRALLGALRALRRTRFDLIWDPQSVLKSALVARAARLAHGGLRVGYRAADCGGEPLAARLYDEHFARPPGVHGTHGRRLFAQAVFDTDCSRPLRYGIGEAFADTPRGAHAVLAHGASKADKLWPEAHWRTLGSRLIDAGMDLVLPWGSTDERERAQRCIDAWPAGRARLAPRGGLLEMARLLAGARVVVGVDSGFSHLAAALGRPLVMLFASTGPELFSPERGDVSVTLGGHGDVPDPEAAAQAVLRVLRAAGEADPARQTS